MLRPTYSVRNALFNWTNFQLAISFLLYLFCYVRNVPRTLYLHVSSIYRYIIALRCGSFRPVTYCSLDEALSSLLNVGYKRVIFWRNGHNTTVVWINGPFKCTNLTFSHECVGVLGLSSACKCRRPLYGQVRSGPGRIRPTWDKKYTQYSMCTHFRLDCDRGGEIGNSSRPTSRYRVCAYIHSNSGDFDCFIASNWNQATWKSDAWIKMTPVPSGSLHKISLHLTSDNRPMCIHINIRARTHTSSASFGAYN